MDYALEVFETMCEIKNEEKELLLWKIYSGTSVQIPIVKIPIKLKLSTYLTSWG